MATTKNDRKHRGRKDAPLPNAAGHMATGVEIEARRREVLRAVIAGTPRALLAERFSVSQSTLTNDINVALAKLYGPQKEEADNMRAMLTTWGEMLVNRHLPLAIAATPNYDSAAVVLKTVARLAKIWGLESVTVKTDSSESAELGRMFSAIDAMRAAAPVEVAQGG